MKYNKHVKSILHNMESMCYTDMIFSTLRYNIYHVNTLVMTFNLDTLLKCNAIYDLRYSVTHFTIKKENCNMQYFAYLFHVKENYIIDILI